jgi:hypothetical protein
LLDIWTVEMPIINNTTSNAGEDVREKEHFYIVVGT